MYDTRFAAGGIQAPSVRHRYEYGAQDTDDRDITLNITVWLPDPLSGADVAFRVMPWLESKLDLSQFQYVVGDSPPHVFGQVSFPSLNTPIELVTVCFISGLNSLAHWIPCAE